MNYQRCGAADNRPALGSCPVQSRMIRGPCTMDTRQYVGARDVYPYPTCASVIAHGACYMCRVTRCKVRGTR